MKFCPKCGSTIMPGINNCPNCGEMVNNFEQGVVESSPQLTNDSGVAVQPAMEVASLVTPVVDNTMAVEPQPMVNTGEVQSMVAPMPQPAMEVAPVVTPVVNNTMAVEPQPMIASVPAVDNNLMPTPEISIPATSNNEPIKEEKKDTKKKEKKVLTPEEKEKKANRIISITVIVISVLAILITTLFLVKAFSKNEVANSNTTVLTTQYIYEGFSFFLPNGVVGSIENGNFVIRDTENTWSAVITIQEGTYNSLVSNKSQISGYFEEFGYLSENIEEKEVSGTSFVTTEVIMGSKNVLVAYAKASGTKVYGILYTNELGTYDSYSLKVVGEVLASAINNGYDSAMPEGFTIDMFKQTFEVAK